MRSLLLIPLFAICPFQAKPNPIPPPPPISELIISQDGFALELDFTLWGIEYLDCIRLVSSSGEANFNPGISVPYDELLVVTGEDLQEPLFIDPAGDFLVIEADFGSGWWEMDRIFFGNHPDSWVSAPLEGESIVKQGFGGYYGQFFWTVKNKPPTPGSLGFWTDSRGTFDGYVLDKNHNGVPYAWIKYCEEDLNGTYPSLDGIYTDSTGYFYCDNMFSREYDIEVIMYDQVYWDDHVSIELEGNNYFEFVIDSFAVGLPETEIIPGINIGNHPNPFTNHTTFDIIIPESYKWHEARIKIIDMNGRVVDRIDCVDRHLQGCLNIYWSAPDNLNSGIYIYTLEIDNKRIASNKMILVL